MSIRRPWPSAYDCTLPRVAVTLGLIAQSGTLMSLPRARRIGSRTMRIVLSLGLARLPARLTGTSGSSHTATRYGLTAGALGPREPYGYDIHWRVCSPKSASTALSSSSASGRDLDGPGEPMTPMAEV